jgi:hypothetical protein
VTGPNDPENEAPRQPETETDQWKFPSWRRVGEFVSNDFQLERNIASLKEDNKRLREEVKSDPAAGERTRRSVEGLADIRANRSS